MTVPITLNNVVNLTNQTTAVNTINSNSTATTTAFGSALDTAGDQMLGNLDMNSNRILNLPSPVTQNEPVRVTDLAAYATGGAVTFNTLPAGGTTNQVLTKNSNSNYDFVWANGAAASATPITSTVSVTGASTTYVVGQTNQLIQRSNSGSPMIDTLPGSTPGILASGTMINVKNSDTAGLLAITAGTGANLKGDVASTGYIYLGPQQSISFYSDGTNYWAVNQPGRCRLQAATTIYISATGASTNHGLTAASPLTDINPAYLLAQKSFDINFQQITFSVANGTYPAVALYGSLIGTYAHPIQGTNVNFVGNAVSPGSVIISTGVANNAWLMTDRVVGLINGFSFNNTFGHCFGCDQNSIALIENVVFATVASGENHIVSTGNAIVYIIGNYTISSSPGAHWITSTAGQISSFNQSGTITVTITGNPAWANAFVVAQYYSLSVVATPMIFSGACTGKRYNAFLNGVINSAGGGSNYFPGTVAGTQSSGGQYA